MFFLSFVKRIFGEHFIVNFTAYIQYKIYLDRFYVKKADNNQLFKGCVYMANGKYIHGGLADRIRGIISLYIYCSERGYPFKILFNSPFNLQDYLCPNEYDWTIDEHMISYSKRNTKVVIIKPVHNNYEKYYEKKMRKILCDSQNHIYTNAFYKKDKFFEGFHKLFKPSPSLLEKINYHRSKIGCNYVSITFRFQNLLGDFRERNLREELSLSRKKTLLEECVNCIYILREKYPDLDYILVTSDSKSFLDMVMKKYDFIYVIPGELSHMDVEVNKQNEFIKSFLDFYMISYAKKVFFYAKNPLYIKSGFAKLAAIIGNTEYEEIV